MNVPLISSMFVPYFVFSYFSSFLNSHQAFRTPFSPWVPAVGVVVSWFLFAQLGWGSLLCTFWATAGVCAWYFVYG